MNDASQFLTQREEAWQSLVHVCRRWRSIVFGSPRHLKLQLVCLKNTPARDTLDVWPALPLIIESYHLFRLGSVDNVIAVLEHSDRVCQINLPDVKSSYLEMILAAMQQPFPELTLLSLNPVGESVSVVPDSFLGGSAPHLRNLTLLRIPFPGLPKLLLSATHLVDLHLTGIPHSGYISPSAMVTALASSTSLSSFWLQFESPRSLPDRTSQRFPPLTRSILPSLTDLSFKGASEYLEDFLARIDAPQLAYLNTTFFNDIAFNTPQFIQFISRTPTSKALEKAYITFSTGEAGLHFSSQTSGKGSVSVRILCQGLDWQLSSLEQVCTSCFPPLSMLEDLCISAYLRLDGQDNFESELWLQLLHPFTTVKNLYLSEQIAPRIGSALQELVGGIAIEVFPALQNISLKGFQPSGPVQEGIRQFVSSRQITGRPITVSRWDDSD